MCRNWTAQYLTSSLASSVMNSIGLEYAWAWQSGSTALPVCNHCYTVQQWGRVSRPPKRWYCTRTFPVTSTVVLHLGALFVRSDSYLCACFDAIHHGRTNVYLRKQYTCVSLRLRAATATFRRRRERLKVAKCGWPQRGILLDIRICSALHGAVAPVFEFASPAHVLEF